MISSAKLKRFVKHLCIVTKHYYERDSARINLDNHVKTAIKSKKSRSDIELLNQKINLLLEKETKLAELGLKKKVPLDVKKKIGFLENEIELLRNERDKLQQENVELRVMLDSGASPLAGQSDESININSRYRQLLVAELNEKISLLETSCRRIADDKSVSPVRLSIIKEKIDSYKEQLGKAGL